MGLAIGQYGSRVLELGEDVEEHQHFFGVVKVFHRK
jgi:hypothetical protein